jgi:hypothetical protein
VTSSGIWNSADYAAEAIAKKREAERKAKEEAEAKARAEAEAEARYDSIAYGLGPY